jgi:two-component system chemotaxis response regulator CheY
MRLLICDDSRTIRVLLRTALAELGHTDIVEAGDGTLALEAIAKQAFDAVLLDLHMPQMDGLAVLRELKSKPATAGLPVVIISSDADMRNVEQARQLGALGYIRKPFRADGIAKALEAVTGGSKGSQRIAPVPPKAP